MTVKIITDSCCDIPLDLANELNITIVPVHIHFGTKDYFTSTNTLINLNANNSNIGSFLGALPNRIEYDLNLDIDPLQYHQKTENYPAI